MAYGAANTFPIKVLLNPPLDRNTILPRHVQLNPTNRCQFHCDYCSCSGRNRKQELSLDQIKDTMRTFRTMGCNTVTITGGGEPLMYSAKKKNPNYVMPQFNEMIEYIHRLGIEIGLVTNGVLLSRTPIETLEKCTWIRVSASNVLTQQLASIGIGLSEWIMRLEDRVINETNVDWAFSYVVSQANAYNKQIIHRLLDFAEKNNFTHVRIVHDILNVRNILPLHLPDNPLINYQTRLNYTKVANPCLISLLKPVVAADGYVYPCCGVQYALANPSRTFERSMRMCHINHLEQHWYKQRFFNGSNCVKCYYNQYNVVLKAIREGVPHEKFV